MRQLFRNLVDAVGLTFCKLARIQFEAPWRTASPPAAC